jgi:two-component system OmpR family response regulator/two-component system response regulator RstA
MDNFTLDTPIYRLLLVEDDQELAGLINEFLTKNGFDVVHISNGQQAVRYIQQERPDMVILDVMLPGLSGMEVCKQVRADYDQPILMLTALDEDMDQMLGLELGADDYVIKPVKPRLLLSRIRALLRRIERSQPPNGTSNPQTLVTQGACARLRIDVLNRAVHSHGAAIHLTTAEFDLLALLADQPGQIVSRDTIVKNLRGFEYDGLDRSIDRRISRLRKKLQDDSNEPLLIKTVRGKGYLLSPDVVVV